MERKQRFTQLKRFLARNRTKELTVTALSRETGYTRPHLYNVMNGTTEPTREFMDLMLVACQKLLSRPVERDDLFEFKPYRGQRRKAS